MTEERFKKLKDFFDDVLQFGETDKTLTTLTRSMPNIYQQAISFYTDQLRVVQEMRLEKDRIYSEGFKYYKEKQNRDYTAKDIDVLMDSNTGYVDICRELAKQEMYCNYLEHTINNIKSISFNINNYINVKKFFQGDSY
jgi:hypothetical protein